MRLKLFQNFLVKRPRPAGQVGLMVVSAMSLAIIAMAIGVGTITMQHRRLTNEVISSIQSYYTAESGVEDALLRVISGDWDHQPTQVLSIGGATATTTITSVDEDYQIATVGNKSERYRKVSMSLSRSGSTGNFAYGMQTGQGGIVIGNNAVVNGNVYSNGEIIGSNGARMNGQVVVAGALDNLPSLEWTNQTADNFFATASGNRDIAQSFTPTSTAPLYWASILVGKTGSPSGTLEVKLMGDSSGSPDKGSVLATENLPLSLISPTANWVTLAFASRPTLTSGTKYWLVLDYSTDSASNYLNWRKDGSDGYAGQTGKYTSNCCTGNPTWSNVNGDLAFKLWTGGTANRLKDVTVGNSTSGAATANIFENATVHGSSCLNQYCTLANPPQMPLPLDAATIQSYRDDAIAGGTCQPPTCDSSGNFILDGSQSASLGPIHITGNLSLDNGAALTITGTILVDGTINLSNGCIISLDSFYGQTSGILMSDDNITISNNCAMSGSGDPSSFLMLLTDKNSPSTVVMDVANNASGVIYYASQGILHLNENATAKNATGYKIIMDNSATVTYDLNLAGVFFWSGGVGSDGWQIQSWSEVE